MNSDSTRTRVIGSEIAIIGMSCRFPGANTIDEYWRNLRDGIESISFFTDQELESSGIDPALIRNPNYVKAKGIIEGADHFDASFFGFTPREVEIMDPQHRLFLECSWEAVENAGYDPDRYDGSIGVFGGVGPNTYFQNNIYPNRSLKELAGDFQIMIGNDKDYLTTRVSYKMNLKGPSIVVQTACSTSLVAIAQACQSLLAGECDIALAGGSSINAPLKAGYLFQPEGIKSPDGHCKAFEERAQGTIFSDGVGVVVLKRLEDALADGDFIHAFVRSAGINNDGSLKIGYAAPSIDGQARAITSALLMAEVEPEDIGYVETHGTATILGDPIEVAALTQAFRSRSSKRGFCAIGSVKTNIGHTDISAGIAGFIKTVLMLENRMIPPSLHFERPNPKIDFESSPFYISSKLSEWKSGPTPRRAGVSAFGIGGTNAHVILEEAPPREPSVDSRPWKLLLLSAKTGSALEALTRIMGIHLEREGGVNLADAAYTLQVGRKAFNHRRTIVCRDVPDAREILTAGNIERMRTSVADSAQRDVVFMFSGQGSQYVDMGLGLYTNEPVFRKELDRCADILQPHLSTDLRKLLYPDDGSRDGASELLTQTYITQPALFAIEYSLARLWMSWGVMPAAMVGHSIGEYVAACLSGVLTLEDALSLVAARGRLMQELPAGSMLAIPLPEKEILPLLDARLSLAVINGARLCVVSGEKPDIESLKERLARNGQESSILQTSHAFHSFMMEPILERFTAKVSRYDLKAPRIPFVSNVTGSWITPGQAADPAYWSTHLRNAVRFHDCLDELLKVPDRILLEVGPGCTLKTLAAQHPGKGKGHVPLSSLRRAKERKDDPAFLLDTLGQLWQAGGVIDWDSFHGDEKRSRIPLPTYPFERKRHWADAGALRQTASPSGTCGETAPAHGISSANQGSDDKGGIASTAAPTGGVENTVVRIWKDSLGVDQVGLSDNFFDLGGHSLLAVTVITEIEKAFGVRLPLASLIEAPTIREFVRLLGSRNPEASLSSLVPLHKGGSKPPFFLMHSHGGNILEYQPLANLLKDDRPIYALQCRGLDGSPIEEMSVEEMASRYLQEIRTVQPKGPYLIGGYCFGGYLALQAAQSLIAENEEVSLLVLINSTTHEFQAAAAGANWANRRWNALKYRVAFEWSELSGQPLDKKYRRIATRARRVGALIRARFEEEIERFSKGKERRHSLTYHLEKLADANDRAWMLYRPAPYPGKVLFLRAQKQSLGPGHDPMLGWGKLLTGDVRLHEVPGFRQNILDEPNVDVMARLILENLS